MKTALAWRTRSSYTVRGVAPAIFLMALAAAAPVGAQTTALFLDSQTGDHIGGGLQRTFTGASATFEVLYDVDGSISATVDGSSSSWALDFAAHSAALQVREYQNATKWPFTPFVGMHVFGDGRSCDRLTGRYWIREIAYGVNGVVERLAVDFEQHCSDDAPALFGALRYNSTISSMTPFDGVYPVYDLSITPPAGGIVSGPGIDCDATNLGCSASLTGATSVTLTARPDPGYLFAGWTGHCHGGRTITIFVNTRERCSALFRPIADTDPATLFFWNSQQGDYIGEGRREIYNEENSRWTLEGANSGSLLLDIESVEDASDSFWFLGFFAPSGSALTTGTYTNVTRFPSETNAGMDIGGNGRGCGVVAGSFTLHELAVVGNVVTRLALDFEQHCDGVMVPAQPLRGSIRYNSDVPVRPTLAVTTTGTGARIALSPTIECVGKCMETYDAGAQFSLIPRPAPGWALAAWSGDADCADGVVTVDAPAACHATFQPATAAADSVAPASGTGLAQVFALQYSSSGATAVTMPWVWFTATLSSSAADSCLLHYDRATGTLFLLNDAGTTWVPAAIGSTGALQNSQCAVDMGASSVSTTGSAVTLNLSMQFRPAYAGAKNIYMFATGTGGAVSGWQDRGDWTVPATTSPPSVTAVGVTPASGSGATQTFTFEYSHALGASELTTAWVWFNTAVTSSAAGSCLVYYDQPAGLLRLIDDAGTAWLAGGTLGGPGTLQNSRCAIALGTSSVVPSGTTLTLTLAMTFRAAFGGAKNVYMFAAGANGLTTGWQLRGTWTVPAGSATADAVTPSSGSGTAGTFGLQYTNDAGAINLATVWVWFNATFTPSAASSCMLYYEPSTNTLRLLNDAGTVWLPGTLGGSGTLQNSQCAVALGSSTATPAGTTLTLSLAMTFKPAFAGAKSIFMFAASAGGPVSGWQTRGTWTVAGATATADAVTPASGTGLSETFALQYGDTAGVADLAQVWVWFTAAITPSAATSCLLYYEPASGTLRLINDAGTDWLPAPLGAGTLQNGQCTVDLASSTAMPAGDTLTLTLAMTFAPSFSGAKNVFLFAASASGPTSGWQQRGTWTVPGVTVTAESATPDSGSGPTGTFVLRYADTVGATDLAQVWVWFIEALAPSAAGSCLLYYEPASGTLHLIDDAGTTWLAAPLGGGGTLQNSHCSVAVGAASATPSGTTLTLTLPVTFSSTFAGAKGIFMFAASAAGPTSGWQQRGTWTVP